MRFPEQYKITYGPNKRVSYFGAVGAKTLQDLCERHGMACRIQRVREQPRIVRAIRAACVSVRTAVQR